MAQSNHDFIERKVGWLIVFTLMTVSVGGLVEIVPLFFQPSTTPSVLVRICIVLAAVTPTSGTASTC